MGARANVFKNDGLEVATGNTFVIEENIVAVISQVFIDRYRPREVCAAVADKDGFLDLRHGAIPLVDYFQLNSGMAGRKIPVESM
jgi:hypothetical protein